MQDRPYFTLPEGRLEQALGWFRFGFQVIPIIPGMKWTAVKWDPWLDGLDAARVEEHWRAHPDHDIGVIGDENLLVLDADGPAASAVLAAIERKHGAAPMLIVKTTRGEHHYFRLAPGTFAKNDAHSSSGYPDRLDVKTHRGLVVLPPGGERSIASCYAATRDDLFEVDQTFVDEVFLHNGRPAPRPLPERHADEVDSGNVEIAKLKRLLDHISPDCGYDDWVQVQMGVYHATGGSDEGLELADVWSSKGRTYKGTREIEAKWRSFTRETANPVTIGTLIMRAREGGADIAAIMGGEEFEPSAYEVIKRDAEPGCDDVDRKHPLGRFSLRGSADDISRELSEVVPVLGKIAFRGQLTALFAAPNTGKTLLAMHLITESIRAGLIDPGDVYYVNCDDNAHGLVAKLQLADEFGFHMLAEGYKGFKAKDLLPTLDRLVQSGAAKNVIVVIDTLKKFADPMDKRATSEFMAELRRFVLKGGTAIVLAHVNKKVGVDGKPIPAGTSDVRDDSDAAYVLFHVPNPDVQDTKFVEFEKVKGRGFVTQQAAYSYAVGDGLSYADLLLSAREVDPADLQPLKKAAKQASESGIIAAIEACIREGIVTKMKLATAAGERSDTSRRIAAGVIEKYTGDDPAAHRWSFRKAARGAFVYALLDRPEGAP